MLSLLHIENIALIESADICFGPGFNVLTGETGAGKSIVIDSIGAVLGERTSRDLIRTGAKSAFVSAVFSDLPELNWTERTGFCPDENGELLLERELQENGRNVCRVNGRPLTVAQLRTLGSQLLNIHGQHDGQQLLNEDFHLEYLDRFGNTGPLAAAYREEYQRLMTLQRELEGLRMDEAEKARRTDNLTYQIEELERANLKPGEDEELENKKIVLRSAGKLMDALKSAEAALGGTGNDDGAVELLSDAAGSVKHSVRLVGGEGEQAETLKELSELLQQTQSDAFDALELIRDLRASLDVSSEDIDRMEDRLDLLYRLKRKYGSSSTEMLAYLQKCRDELDQIRYSDDRIAQLEKEQASLTEKVRRRGKELSDVRHRTAERLQARIQRELYDLDMPKVRFQVQFRPVGGKLGMDASGMDQVSFLMSANMGEDLKPISRIASGGELARIMLALKNVLAESDDVSTLIFDEVDTGVSGHAAIQVARKLAQVAKQKQILCVTHLPQIASMADLHFFVQKAIRKERTFTDVLQLPERERAKEIARLTGGERVTESMVTGAEELLTESKKYKNAL